MKYDVCKKKKRENEVYFSFFAFLCATTLKRMYRLYAQFSIFNQSTQLDS